MARFPLMKATRHCAALLALALTLGCAEEELDTSPPPEIQVGESREVELRYTRFDVRNFEQTFTRDDLLALPVEVQERLWLLDLNIINSAAAPRLLDSSLAQIQSLPPEELTPAARNMQQLLNTTPDNANLEGTSFEEVIQLSTLIGVSPQSVLADMLGVNVEDTFLTTSAVAQTIVDNVISSHPNAQFRRGPVTASNPEGIYPVAPGSLPVTMRDAASDFATLSERFGPAFIDGVAHPGFITGDVRAQVFSEDFRMTVRANTNALPYKGIDLTNGGSASVNSTASQINQLFDFNDPNWLTVEGLLPGVPVIEEMTFRIEESDRFIDGGRSPFPAPFGDSEVWQLPPWTLERILADATLNAYEDLNSEVVYQLPDSDDNALDLQVEDGWTVIETAGGLGSPPVPQYIWDVILEVGQVRLHDGGIPEGEADVAFTLRDVPVGVDSEQIEATIRENIQADPGALLDVAAGLLDNTFGEADFYYYRPDRNAPEEIQGDYLYFVAPQDIGLDDEGNPVRPYDYEAPGFYADPDLTERISSLEDIEGDTSHEKLRINPGDTFYVGDNAGRVYQIDVLEKAGLTTIELRLTRIR